MSMSIFGSLMGDLDNDLFFGSTMRQMRRMDSMMSSLFHDSFGMGMFRDFEHNRANIHNSLMSSFNMPIMPNFNRLLSSSLDSMGPMAPMAPMGNCSNYSSSSTVVSMTSGPDGRPQVYKATSSTRVAPGGIKEVQRTVTDTASGTKKMAIGHHIGERAHIIEKEQNMHTGDKEEREDFINLEEDEADEFNREWQTKTRCISEIPRISSGSARNRHTYGGYPAVPAITAGPSSRRHRERSTTPMISARRSIRPSKLALPSTTVSSSSARTPYSPPVPAHSRKSKNIKTVSGDKPENK